MERVVDPKRGKSSDGRQPECVVLPLDAGWSDVGAWSAVWEEGEQDAQGNVIRGDVYAQSMRNSLLIGQHRLLSAVGLEDVIIVETADAVLVAHKDSVQDIRELVARLKAEGRPEQQNHRKVHRPWGSYETVDSGPRFQVKRLTVNPGAALSLQMHHHRAEHWVVVKGTAKVTRGDEEFLLTENESTNVPVGVTHRLENPGTIPLELIEVQSGAYLGEDDITRFEDRYDRHPGGPPSS
jgi:mannose-1-phosphate guanylyltransferase/mannose-6-phosphate isomerase